MRPLVWALCAGWLALAVPAYAQAPTPIPLSVPANHNAWEYRIVETYGLAGVNSPNLFGLGAPTELSLNEWGAQGWELVAVTRATSGERVFFTFKRQIRLLVPDPPGR